jgi:hypothetical protein
METQENILSPNEIARIAQLSFILEPISNKPGLTTRYSNKNSNLKLENFLVAGINIGDAFRELAERLYKCKELPITYDIALQAQKDSFKNRMGSRVAYGGIIGLFPIIITQIRIKSNRPYEILDNIENILKQTYKEDVLYYQELEHYAYSHFYQNKKCIYEMKDDCSNIFEYLEKDLLETINSKIVNKQFSSKINRKYRQSSDWISTMNELDWDTPLKQTKSRAKSGSLNKEIINGYPIVRTMLDIFYTNVQKGKYLGISETLEEIDFLVKRKFPNIYPAHLAELQTCFLYLVITYDNKDFFV